MSEPETDEQPGAGRGPRWDRIFLTTTVLLLAAVIWMLPGADETEMHVSFWTDGTWTVERTASLTHPDPGGDVPAPMKGTGRSLRVTVTPGHWKLAFTPSGASGAMTVPFLVRPGETAITCSLPEPPPGFVCVPAGAFIRGPSGPVATTDALFFAALHEVSRAQWDAFLKAVEAEGADAWRSEAERIAFPDGGVSWAPLASWRGGKLGDREGLPANGVNWYAAQAFARWFTERHGGGRYRFRLPTALEWEKLARGTDGRLYPWGRALTPDPKRALEEQELVPVDSRPETRSPYGVFHAFGNVAEWCDDPADATALTRRVMGPSASGAADLMRLAFDASHAAHERLEEVGVRLVAEPVR